MQWLLDKHPTTRWPSTCTVLPSRIQYNWGIDETQSDSEGKQLPQPGLGPPARQARGRLCRVAGCLPIRSLGRRGTAHERRGVPGAHEALAGRATLDTLYAVSGALVDDAYACEWAAAAAAAPPPPIHGFVIEHGRTYHPTWPVMAGVVDEICAALLELALPSPEAIVERTLLCADLVDSTQRNVELGDAAMAHLWQQHDAGARELMRRWRGMEIARSDGFLVLFDQPRDAVAFAAAYHRMLGALEPALAARVGIHHGPLGLRENTTEDRARGALPFEVDGVALPVTARIGAVAQARQTLISAEGAGALGVRQSEAQSLGYWQFKGVAEPMELFEIVADGALRRSAIGYGEGLSRRRHR